MPPLKDRLATHIVPFSEFERDAGNGTLPDFSLIEPLLVAGHGDYHPAEGRSFSVTTSTSPSTRRPRSSPARTSWRVSTGRSDQPTPPRAQTPTTPRSSSAGTSLGEPTTTFLRPGAPAGPQHPGRGVRLHLRPLRLPRARDHRLPVDRRGHGDQRRVPPHLAARHAAQELTWATRSATGTPPPAHSITCSPWRRPETPRAGPTCTRVQCRNGSSLVGAARSGAQPARQGHRPGARRARQAGRTPDPRRHCRRQGAPDRATARRGRLRCRGALLPRPPRLRNPLMPGARRRAGGRGPRCAAERYRLPWRLLTQARAGCWPSRDRPPRPVCRAGGRGRADRADANRPRAGADAAPGPPGRLASRSGRGLPPEPEERAIRSICAR